MYRTIACLQPVGGKDFSMAPPPVNAKFSNRLRGSVVIAPGAVVGDSTKEDGDGQGSNRKGLVDWLLCCCAGRPRTNGRMSAAHKRLLPSYTTTVSVEPSIPTAPTLYADPLCLIHHAAAFIHHHSEF
jgi:hypothetical protein